jgi:2-C-methyl-D-erythritol 4-phosphate cytidylyltransferase
VPVLGVGDGLGWLELGGWPLFVHAARALGEAAGAAIVSAAASEVGRVRAALDGAGLGGAQVFAGGSSLGAVLAGEVLAGAACVLVHDPCCPLVPPSHLAEVLAQARQTPSEVVVSTRPMTDTVKSVVDGFVHATVDRDHLRVLSSPVALPAALLRGLPYLARIADLSELLDALRAVGAPVHWVTAPPSGRRIGSAADVAVLAALSVGPAAAGLAAGRPQT